MYSTNTGPQDWSFSCQATRSLILEDSVQNKSQDCRLQPIQMLKTFWVALGYQCPFQERVLASFSFSLSVSHSLFYRDGGKGDRYTEKDWKEYGYKQAGNKHYLVLKSGMRSQETVNTVMWKPSAADAAALLRYTAHISTGYAQPHRTQLCTSHLTPRVARSFLSHIKLRDILCTLLKRINLVHLLIDS